MRPILLLKTPPTPSTLRKFHFFTIITSEITNWQDELLSDNFMHDLRSPRAFIPPYFHDCDNLDAAQHDH